MSACADAASSGGRGGTHQYTTTTFPTQSQIPDSIRSGTSRTHTRSPRSQHFATCHAIARRTAGCTMALSVRRRASSANTSAPSFGRSRYPSGCRISRPNAATIWAYARVPGRTASRAMTSASTTGMARAASSAETVDLPVAIPPVRPTTARGKVRSA